MNKEKLSAFKRYFLVVILTFTLLMIGSALMKSWNMTPEKHYEHAVILLNENSPDKALPHLLLANKSQIPSVKSMSAYYLAHLYHQGANGIPKNIRKAVYYYEQAADAKIPSAQYQLALLYDTGDKIPENRDKAIYLMMEAAKVLPEAKYALAVWIERGYFGEPNQAWAVALYEQAANSGIKNAIKSLISIYHGGYGRFPENIRRERYWRRRLEGKQK